MQISNQLHAFIWESYTENNCNTYLIDGPTRILIDPGHMKLFGHVQNGLKELGLELDDIGVVICTHAHPDHIESVQLFKKTNAQIAIHEQEWELAKAMSKHMNIDLDLFTPDFFLNEGDLSIKGIDLNVFHTPGHSPGSVTLYWPAQKALFTGDVIFKDGLGRTDLPGGNSDQLKESIRRLSQIEVDCLLSGHGEIISGEKAVKENFDHLKHFWFSRI